MNAIFHFAGNARKMNSRIHTNKNMLEVRLFALVRPRGPVPPVELAFHKVRHQFFMYFVGRNTCISAILYKGKRCMQMNRWFTDVEPEDEGASHSPVRPRASVWIDSVAQYNVSSSYIAKKRHVIPNPQTPIPARASAQQSVRLVKVRPRYPRNYTVPQGDVTRIPTLPQATMWQYELPDYEAESSLSSLSLAQSETSVDRALDELDTLPPPRVRAFDAIDEINTVPQPKKNTLAAQKFPTTTEQKKARGSTLASIVEGNSSKLVGASWTTGQGKNSLLAKRIASRGQRKSVLSLNPIDRLRWWLLYPGRIEFLLWLSGTIVLVSVTCLLLFATLLSTGWLNANMSSIAVGVGGGPIQTSSTPAHTVTVGKSFCTVTNAVSPQCHSTTVVSPSGLKLTLIDDALLLPNMPIYLHGQGFTANNTVNFTYDASLPCRPNIISTDTRGSFSLYLMFDGGVKAGTHQLVAYDVATKRVVTVDVSISESPMGKSAQQTPTHTVPDVTPTSTSSAGDGFPTPVGQTPIPIIPTISVTPTVAPTQQSTPTIGITTSPTIGVTPTASVIPTMTSTTTSTSETKNHGAASILKNALYDEYIGSHISISIWLWIAAFGYSLSIVLLGCAGLLYRRNRHISSK